MIIKNKIKITIKWGDAIKNITNRSVKYAIYILIIALVRVVRLIIDGRDIKETIRTTIIYFMGLFLILVLWGFVADFFKKRKKDKSDDSESF